MYVYNETTGEWEDDSGATSSDPLYSSSGLWNSDYDIGDIADYIGGLMQSGDITQEEAMAAMQSYNVAATTDPNTLTSSWADYLKDPAAYESGSAGSTTGAGSSGFLSSLTNWLSSNTGLNPTQLGGLGAAGLGSLLSTYSGSKPAGTTTTSEEPWSAQKPYLVDLFNKASTQFGSKNPMMGQANTNFGSLLGGPTKNPYAGDNPYLTQSINNAQSDFMRGFQPLVNQANQQSGSFGNTGVAQTFGNEAANQLGKISTNMRFQDYANQQQLGESAVNRTANATMGANDFSFAPLQQYGSLIRGQYGGSTSTPYFNNTAGNLLGGAAAGSSIYNNLFGQKAGA